MQNLSQGTVVPRPIPNSVSTLNDVSKVKPIPPARSFSEERVHDKALRHIEERLEKISEAIRKIDDDSTDATGGTSSKNIIQTEYRKPPRRTVRMIKEASHRTADSRYSQLSI